MSLGYVLLVPFVFLYFIDLGLRVILFLFFYFIILVLIYDAKVNSYDEVVLAFKNKKKIEKFSIYACVAVVSFIALSLNYYFFAEATNDGSLELFFHKYRVFFLGRYDEKFHFYFLMLLSSYTMFLTVLYFLNFLPLLLLLVISFLLFFVSDSVLKKHETIVHKRVFYNSLKLKIRHNRKEMLIKKFFIALNDLEDFIYALERFIVEYDNRLSW